MRRLSAFTLALVAALIVAPDAARADDPIQHRPSTLGDFAIYVQPRTDANGAEIGIRVYYSTAALRDRPSNGAHFAGVCAGTFRYACYEQTARAWVSGTGQPGAWWWLDIGLNCAAGATTHIEVLQPYLSTARLNFAPINSPPYQSGQYFYQGNVDSAFVQVTGCHQVLT